MSRVFRFGVSIEKDLLDRFDRLIGEMNYTNRSEALRDLIREALVRKEWEKGEETAGAITLVYNHHQRELLNRITDVQHGFQKIIISTQHVHLDHAHCLEIIAVRGNPKEAQRLMNTLRSLKGIKHGTLSMTSTGKEIE